MIAATAQILSKDGLDRLSTNRIAARAGVSIGSLYQYFPNKEALLAELSRRYAEQFVARTMDEIGRIGPLPLREAIREFIRFMIEIHAEDPHLHNALAERVPESDRQFLEQTALAYLKAHQGQLRKKDLEVAAYVCIQAGEALTHGTALRDPELLADPRFADEIVDLIVRYLEK